MDSHDSYACGEACGQLDQMRQLASLAVCMGWLDCRGMSPIMHMEACRELPSLHLLHVKLGPVARSRLLAEVWCGGRLADGYLGWDLGGLLSA